MHANTYFCIAFLGCELANFLHWGADRGKQLHYLPKSGWLRIMMVLLITVTITAIIAATLVHLMGVTTSQKLIWLLCAFPTFHAGYSIAHRHRLRKQKYLQQVTPRRLLP